MDTGASKGPGYIPGSKGHLDTYWQHNANGT